MFEEKLAIERWCGMSLSQSSPMGQWSATTSATNRLMMMVMMVMTMAVVVVVCFDQRNPTILRGFQILLCIRCCFSNSSFFQFGSKSPHQFYDLDRYQWHKTRCLLSHLTPSPYYASKPYVNTIIMYYVLPYLAVDKNIARIANAVQVTIRLLVSTSVY